MPCAHALRRLVSWFVGWLRARPGFKEKMLQWPKDEEIHQDAFEAAEEAMKMPQALRMFRYEQFAQEGLGTAKKWLRQRAKVPVDSEELGIGEEAVGKLVSVFWDDDQQFYDAYIQRCASSS